jgi:hypothetical protein
MPHRALALTKAPGENFVEIRRNCVSWVHGTRSRGAVTIIDASAYAGAGSVGGVSASGWSSPRTRRRVPNHRPLSSPMEPNVLPTAGASRVRLPVDEL